MKKTFVTLLLGLVLGAAVVAAQVPDGKWWKHPRVAAEIGLTAEQSRDIEKIFVRSRTRLIDLKADLEKKQLVLQDAMEDQGADRKAVEKKIEAVENARAELQKTRALMILDMKQVLKPEQWDRLKQKQQERRENLQQQRRMMRDDGARPRPGPEGRRPGPEGRRPGGDRTPPPSPTP